MNIQIEPRPLLGTIDSVSSKSEVHRLMICAALADHPTSISFRALSRDIEATANCLRALTAGVRFNTEGAEVSPVCMYPDAPLLSCGESGSTLRFLMPVAAALCERVTFTGEGRLPDRPLSALLNALAKRGVHCSAQHLPLTLSGKLAPGLFELPGDVSSQFVSGLLFALPLLKDDSEIRLTEPLQSVGYVKMTLEAISSFGISVLPTDRGFYVKGNQKYHSGGQITAGGDWSNAAFWLAAGALSGPVTCTGLRKNTLQGDSAITRVIQAFGAQIRSDRAGITALRAEKSLLPQKIDCTDIPDLVPVLSVLSAFAVGQTVFTGAGRLRYKESDRLMTTAAMLKNLGADVQENPEGLTVTGKKTLPGGTVDGAGDHRIVMSAAVAAVGCEKPVTILGAEAVEKSYPRFFDDYSSLGGVVHVL